jgi:hypothetical protein
MPSKGLHTKFPRGENATAWKEKFGSLGKIRTSNPSVNSGRGGKSKCRVWCRLQKNGAIFPALVAPNAAPKMAITYAEIVGAC